MQLQPREALPKIMLARYYGDDLPRFLSPDPISLGDEFDPQSWNLYTYVGNNPLAYVDPTGEEMVYAVEMQLFLQSSAEIRSQHGITDPGHLDGFWLHDPASDVQAGLNASTNSWDVIFQSWIKIASDHQTPLGDLIKHEFGHQGDFEASVRQAGYQDLDKQLDRTWQRVQRQGQRKGWSADETNRRALDAVKNKMEKAYKKIAKIYKKKQQKRDRPKPNSYGIDPDGPFGPAPHPCVGQPVC